MKEQARRGETVAAGVVAQVFDKTEESWAAIKGDVVKLTEYAHGIRLFSTDDRIEEWTQRHFLNPHPDSVRVLLKKGDKVIGFSSAHRAYSWSEDKKCMCPSPTEAEIDLVVIAPEEQRHGYIGIVTDVMEDELRQRDFERFWIIAREDYAKAMERHYGARVAYSSYMNPSEKVMEVTL